MALPTFPLETSLAVTTFSRAFFGNRSLDIQNGVPHQELTAFPIQARLGERAADGKYQPCAAESHQGERETAPPLARGTRNNEIAQQFDITDAYRQIACQCRA